jgi:hypothetical protein
VVEEIGKSPLRSINGDIQFAAQDIETTDMVPVFMGDKDCPDLFRIDS